MSWAKEFKDFALKGSMMDLALGVILGIAFGKVVSSLVSDVLMPPLGVLIGGVDFSALSIKIGVGAGLEPVEIKYGLFINALISFLIIAFAVFVIVKGISKFRPAPPAGTKPCPECLMAVPAKAKKCGHCCSAL